jgi:periplasmic divalent cation tolerance protein
MSTDYVIVFVTTKDKAEAEKIAQALLQEKLIACANVISPVESCFHWLGKIDTAEECLIIMKSRASLFLEIERRVKALHSYEVPEVLALPIIAGSAGYLDWVDGVLR